MTILQGKIAYAPVWNLEIVLRPEFIVDYVSKFSASQQKNLHATDQFPWENLEITVMLDQICLLKHLFTDPTPVSINQYFSDAGELAEHTITVALAGADVNNNFLVNDHTITLGIDTELRIEGVDLEWYLRNHLCFLTQNNTLEYGRKFMSENGQQQITLQTPIYPWLMTHEESIVKQFSQKDL